MELTGLRWRHQIGNSTIDVDNAVGGSLWSQERLVVNGEPLYGGGGRLRFLQRFREPWLTPDGEREIRVTLSPGVGVVRCRLSLDGLRLDPLEILHARWYGDRSTWPTEDAWLR